MVFWCYLIRMKVWMVLVMAAAVAAHDWDWGRCPTAIPMAGFDVDKFLGLWYVLEQVDTSSTCLTLTYARTGNVLSVTKARQLVLLDTFGVSNINTYKGVLTTPNINTPATMRVKWSLNVSSGDYVVLDTDYVNYAAVYDCQGVLGFSHRHSAAILARAPVLSLEETNKVKFAMAAAGVMANMDAVSHTTCTSNPEIHIDINSETFKESIKDAAAVIKTLWSLYQAANGATAVVGAFG